MIKQQLRGTGVAIVTPFNKDLSVDYPSLGKLIDFILENGVQYIVTLGTTGEAPVLSIAEKNEIINYTADRINGRCPLVIGVGGNYTDAVLNELRQLPVHRGVAILSACPYYNKPSQEGLFQHYKTLAEASPLPVILYNVPSRSGRNISSATTLRLAREVKNIAGIKEAAGDMVQCMEILRDAPTDFLVVSGDDALALPQIACGMQGVISVAANCFPRYFSQMVNAALSGELAEAKKINDKLLPAYNLLFEENNPAGVKSFLSEMKLIGNYLRLPLVPVEKKLQGEISDWLKNNE